MKRSQAGDERDDLLGGLPLACDGAGQLSHLPQMRPTAGGVRGLGYTYAYVATGQLIKEMLAHVVTRCDAMAVPCIG